MKIMEREHIIYSIFMIFFIILDGLILITPLLAFSSDVEILYEAFSVTCHQKLSRSLCVFSNGNGYWIADCMPQTGEYIKGPSDRHTLKVESDGNLGYKMPVCARDVGLYFALLIGGALYPIFREIKERKIYPAIFLILAIIPIGLDGGIQLLSDIGIISLDYESTNLTRLLTGGMAGLVSAFYAIPILVNMFSEEKKTKNQQGSSGSYQQHSSEESHQE